MNDHRGTHAGRRMWLLPLAVAAACARPVQQPAPFNGAVILEIPIDSVRAYASKLRFDPRPPAAHEEHVDFARGVLGGDNVARIEPTLALCTIDSLALASGWIVARLRSENPYPPLGPWWTYVWMDRFGPENSWRVVLFAPEARVVVDSVWLHVHDSVPGAPQAARFRTWGEGVSATVRPCYCCSYGWCGYEVASAARTAAPHPSR